jgi:2-C-methyl-D-erythritol 4-phosphate cytidylyltransferase
LEWNFPPPLAGEGQGGGLVLVNAVPITDTCKEVVDGLVRRTVPRDALVDVRGPWLFDRSELISALDAASTSDVATLLDLCRAVHLRVRVLTQS